MILALFSASTGRGATGDADPANLFDFHCGKPGRPGGTIAPTDYRERLVSLDTANGLKLVESQHYEKALEEMRKPRPYTPAIVGNLDFQLRHYPNHHLALAAMIEWELRGGNFHGYRTSNCYLQWAHEFARDDATVLMYGGNYFSRKRDAARARAWYQRALELEPASAELNYNYGLFLVGLREYEPALYHAQIAYSAGFPLPGLRSKLEQAGYKVQKGPIAESK